MKSAVLIFPARAWLDRFLKEEFKDLEHEMKEITVGNKIEKLGLR